MAYLPNTGMNPMLWIYTIVGATLLTVGGVLRKLGRKRG